MYIYAYMLFSCFCDFCDSMDYSPSDSSVHATLQVRILEWVAISSPGAGEKGHLPDPEIKLACPTLADRFFTTERPGKPACM